MDLDSQGVVVNRAMVLLSVVNALALIRCPAKSMVWEEQLVDAPPATHVTTFKITPFLHWRKTEDE